MNLQRKQQASSREGEAGIWQSSFLSLDKNDILLLKNVNRKFEKYRKELLLTAMRNYELNIVVVKALLRVL